MDDYIEGNNANLPTGNSPRTIEAWIKPSAIQDGTIFNWGTFGSTNYNEKSGISYINKHLHFTSNSYDLQANTVIDTGSWYHVAASFNGTLVKLYVNGVLAANDYRYLH